MPTLERMSSDALRRIAIVFRDLLRRHSGRINRLNVFPVPDGDTGTNMARTLDAVVAELDAAEPGMAPTCAAISHGSLMGARGNSGVILSQILRGLCATLRDLPEACGEASGQQVAEALEAASRASYEAVLEPTEGTILTVAREAAAGAQQAAADGATLHRVLRAAREAGQQALAATPDLLPVLRDAGVVDAGGAGFLLLLDAALHVVAGESLPEPDDDCEEAVDPLSAAPPAVDADGADQRYEVMCFVDLDDGRVAELKRGWGEIGDSIVVVGGDGLWNCHVHTNDIGAAIEVPLELGGRPKQIRVTDLFEEVAAEHAHREAALLGGAPRPDRRRTSGHGGLPPVTCAVVAVASGGGLAELFGQLGVQGVITGGQTLNPSTAELLSAVEAVNADEVVVLPNNKNIVPVAEQLDSLSAKHVVVVATTSMPAALAALVVYDPELTADANRAAMADAAAAVATGEITRAVRSAASGVSGAVAEGDWIGVVRGVGIIAVSVDLDDAIAALLEHLVDDGREIVTIIEGVDATTVHTARTQAWLADHWPGVEVEVHRGGQPVYPYLFGVE